MNEATHNQLVGTLRETPCAGNAAVKHGAVIGVRVSPGVYFALAAVLTFLSVILLRTQRDFGALLLVTMTWIVIPILVATDRLYFDGETVFRSGFAPMLSRLLRGRRPQLAIADIERVEVAAVRTLRRGGSVHYRYSVEITGKNQTFGFASGGEKFRQMVKALLPRVTDAKLDARACELRDYLCGPKMIRAQVNTLGIATPSVLENADDETNNRFEKRIAAGPTMSADEAERAHLLREAANRLRIAGRLRESAEAFRRALHLTPRDPWLLYEYGRLLRSQASAFSDARLLTRACAALKLALMRGDEDARLAERVGESLFEFGQPARAAKTLRRAIEIDPNSFRAFVVLAEIALSEGKLAHVIHHYRDAARVASDQACATMAQTEADYYSRLHDDEDYLTSELRRMNWLESAGRVQQFAARVSFAALLLALTGSFINPLVSGIGWALACSSIMGWFGAVLAKSLLSRRRRTNPVA